MQARGPFAPQFSELPDRLPLFPLGGALLLPGGRLPLNIFEPRYLAMVREAIAAPHRLIGMIQPDATKDGLYQIGCAGRVSEFAEQDDGRIVITLTGLVRFQLLESQELEDGYLQGLVSWHDFSADLSQDNSAIDRPHLMRVLHDYFDAKGYKADWDQLESCEDERLVTSLAMICPFDEAEKQAMLEAPSLAERAQLLTAILEMSVHQEFEKGPSTH